MYCWIRTTVVMVEKPRMATNFGGAKVPHGCDFLFTAFCVLKKLVQVFHPDPVPLLFSLTFVKIGLERICVSFEDELGLFDSRIRLF